MRTAPRDAVWAAIRELRTFSLPEIIDSARVNRDIARSYLRGLVLSGHVEPTGLTRRRPRSFGRGTPELTLINDEGVHAPQITGKGLPIRKGRGYANLWRTIKILRQFSHVDLAIAASTTEIRISRVYAGEYVTRLRDAGYLQLRQASHSGGKGRAPSVARYQLIEQRWTGPRAPQVKQRTNEVYDPNLGRLVTRATWSELP